MTWNMNTKFIHLRLHRHPILIVFISFAYIYVGHNISGIINFVKMMLGIKEIRETEDHHDVSTDIYQICI